MTTVAIVGVEGAGKSTVARRLVAASPVPAVYMGVNPESSNYALPTSRLIVALKLRSYRRQARRLGIATPGFISTRYYEHREDRRGYAGATLRLANPIAEASYRHLIAWWRLRRGRLVVFDRSFLFETVSLTGAPQRTTFRIENWLHEHLFPRPSLTVMLDAPPELLHARKTKTTLEHLIRGRRALLEQGARTLGLIVLDATQPVDRIVEDILGAVARHGRRRTDGRGAAMDA